MLMAAQVYPLGVLQTPLECLPPSSACVRTTQEVADQVTETKSPELATDPTDAMTLVEARRVRRFLYPIHSPPDTGSCRNNATSIPPAPL